MKESIEDFIDKKKYYDSVNNEYIQALDIYNSKDESFDTKLEEMRLKRIINSETNNINFIGFLEL